MKRVQRYLLVGIIILAAFLRFYNINWDQGFHLHPDERFLTMVGNNMQIPSSFMQYLDSKTSTINPTNIGYSFYVYGTLPVLLNKIVAVGLNTDTYNDFTLQGRLMSGLFDLFTLLILIKFLRLLCRHRNLPEAIIPLGAFFYAVAVLPIQLSHFFAVDTFLTFFVLSSIYFLFKFIHEGKIQYVVLSGIFIGFAFGAKISALYVLPLFPIILFWNHWRQKKRLVTKKFLGILFLFAICFYFTIRIAGPYYFESSMLIDPRPNTTFLQNIDILKSYNAITFPPSVQWYSTTPVVYVVKNIAFYGLGTGYFVLMIIGILYFIKRYKKYTELTILFVWMMAFFLYQSVQLVKAMRYFIYLFPFFAFLAALGFEGVFSKGKIWAKSIAIIFVLIWPLSFFSIYVSPMTRVEASYWINENIPKGSVILTELWDDALPLPLPGNDFKIEQMPVFDQDTPEKWQRMGELIERGDYIILSSNRGWGSISKVPENYPTMSAFYNDLLEGKLNYKKIQDFTSYPSLTYIGIPISIPDDNAGEPFTVYDHPRVMIFQHER